MKDLIIIAALGKNNELGKNNDLIWRSKEDMKFFKETTTGHNIVMGRNTFKSLPGVLPNRNHIILTRSDIILPDRVKKCNSIDSFLHLSKNIDDDIYVIGGAQIYNELMSYCNKMYLTEFNESCLDADVFFPKINEDEWNIEIIGKFEENTPKYLRKVYTRK